VINDFLLSRDAGVEVTEVTVEALKKAQRKYFSQVNIEIKSVDGRIYLLNKTIIENSEVTSG